MNILFLISSLGCVGQMNDEAKLTKVMGEFHQALVNENTGFLEAQSDKALSYGHSNGWVETKADLIKDLETGYISYQQFKEDSITVSINGAMANIRFNAQVTATLKGAKNNFHLKVLEVWVKKNKQWRMFSRQAIKMQ